MSNAQQKKYASQSSNTGSPANSSNNPVQIPLPTYFARQQSNTTNPNATSTDPNQFQQSPDIQGAASISKNQPTSRLDSRHDRLLGQVVPLGKDSYTIQGYIKCENEELFALECNREISGYDGTCPKCHRQHVYLKASRGYYASVDSILKALEQQKMEKERLKGPKTIDQLNKVEDNLSPLNHAITGINKGIEGNSNSCYMDSTVFCMFAYSSVFDSLLHMDVTKNKSIVKLQKLLRENIVNVLRSETGFVERDALFHLRKLVGEATNDPTFIEMEKDPREFLVALEKIFHYAPLKTIPPDQPPNENGSNMTTNIIWEMFDANPQGLPFTTIAGIFRNSLSEIPARLASIPPFLILMAPRHTRSQRSYRYIIPDRQITLDSKIVQHVCLECKQTNGSDQLRDFYFCNDCYSKDSSSLSTSPTDTAIVCYCSACLSELHKKIPKEELVQYHQPKQMKNIKYKLNLFAVLCIETSHYVAFVKCHKSDQQHEWIFFDSMSDRIYNEKNVPCVSRAPNFDRWIDAAEKDQYFFEDLDRRRNQGRPTSQTFSEDEMRQLRLFRDGAFFFYENSAVNYQ